MAIEKYTTKSIILKAYPQGEHDYVYKLFTRDFGVVMAIAKSVRKLESKLRPHLIPGKSSVVTMVKGRDIWRITGAVEDGNPSASMRDITLLVSRFMQGEGAHKKLFDRLVSFADRASSYEETKARALLYYILLVDLGYADAKVIGAATLEEYISWSVDDLYTHLLLSYENVRRHVHTVLKVMQL